MPSLSPPLASALRAAFGEGENGKNTAYNSLLKSDALKKSNAGNSSPTIPPTQVPHALATTTLLEIAQKRYQDSIRNRLTGDKGRLEGETKEDSKGGIQDGASKTEIVASNAHTSISAKGSLPKLLGIEVPSQARTHGLLVQNVKNESNPPLEGTKTSEIWQRTSSLNSPIRTKLTTGALIIRPRRRGRAPLKEAIDVVSVKKGPKNLNGNASHEGINVSAKPDKQSSQEAQVQTVDQAEKEKPTQSTRIARSRGPTETDTLRKHPSTRVRPLPLHTKSSQPLSSSPLSRENVTIQGKTIKDALLTPKLARRTDSSIMPIKDTERKIADMEGLKAPISQIDARNLEVVGVDVDQPPVPMLSYGLDRVLFNPGIFQLQDPRSRVYNFDPYLQTIMPVSEFDFTALKGFTTSSKDSSLQEIAQNQGKRYIGSTSSMSSVLSHFHFLLSQWREINANTLSKAFPSRLNSFTMISRAPQAIFLKWQNGTYAIDADKEFASTGVLSLLGRSMEKLLTLNTKDYENYRKSNQSPSAKHGPESFHYTTMGDFLMRSQLDAYDPRLPGTGMFDLKTRAVVAVRMENSSPEMGSGYEIKNRFGEWESYEREYFDMIRAAMLKYSLQVRMGRMDGIFVAYHNTERIFGFQYVSLPELDLALHGQEDIVLGDQEFKMSLALLNRILNRATKKYPEQSLRIHIETREAQTTFMYAFAEPVTEEKLQEIQTRNDVKMAEVERDILGLEPEPEDLDDAKAASQWSEIHANVEEAMDNDEKSLTNSDYSATGETANRVEEHSIESESDRQSDGIAPEVQPHDQETGSATLFNKQASDPNNAGQEDSAQATRDEQPTLEPSEFSSGSVNSEETASLSTQGTEGEQGIIEKPEIESNAHVQQLETETDNAKSGPTYLESHDSTIVPDAEADTALDARREEVQQSLSEHRERQPEIPPPGFSGKPDDTETVSSEGASDPISPAVSEFKELQSAETERQTALPGSDDTPKGPDDASIDAREGAWESASAELATSMNQIDEAANSPSAKQTEEAAKSPPIADTAFLDEIIRESDEVVDSKPEVLGMVLTIRNKVNKSYVLRPTNLGVRDDWAVEYALENIKAHRAWPLYQACKLRRKKTLETLDKPDEQVAANFYLQQMRRLSREGKKYRKQMNRADEGRPIVVYGSTPVKGDVQMVQEEEEEESVGAEGGGIEGGDTEGGDTEGGDTEGGGGVEEGVVSELGDESEALQPHHRSS